MKLFITGSESFIGKELIKYCLENSIEFKGIDKSKSDKPHSINIDIRDKSIENYIEKDSIIIHLAAVSRDSDCRDDCINAFDINVNGTINLINAAKKKKVKQFIFASSEWVYGNTINNSEQIETDKIDITSMESEYAITKIIGEQLIKINNTQFVSTILRFGIIYGPRTGNWSAFEAIFNLVRTKNKAEIGSLKTSRRFIHVKDTIIKDGKPRFVIPGESGKIDYAKLVSLSAKLGYRGDINAEISGQVWGQKGYDPIATAKTSYRNLSAAFESGK